MAILALMAILAISVTPPPGYPETTWRLLFGAPDSVLNLPVLVVFVLLLIWLNAVFPSIGVGCNGLTPTGEVSNCSPVTHSLTKKLL